MKDMKKTLKRIDLEKTAAKREEAVFFGGNLKDFFHHEGAVWQEVGRKWRIVF